MNPTTEAVFYMMVVCGGGLGIGYLMASSQDLVLAAIIGLVIAHCGTRILEIVIDLDK